MQHSTIGRRITLAAAAFMLTATAVTRAQAQVLSAQSMASSMAPVSEIVRSTAGPDAAPTTTGGSVFGKITPSFSIAPKIIFRRRGARGAMFDYAKQTVWLSANVHDVLPRSAKPYWPSALRLSAGRRGLGAGLPAEYVLGLDLDAARLPGTHPAWMQVKNVLHTLRLPGPAIVMGPNGTRALGLYW